MGFPWESAAVSRSCGASVGVQPTGMECQVPQLPELMTDFRITQRHRGCPRPSEVISRRTTLSGLWLCCFDCGLGADCSFRGVMGLGVWPGLAEPAPRVTATAQAVPARAVREQEAMSAGHCAPHATAAGTNAQPVPVLPQPGAMIRTAQSEGVRWHRTWRLSGRS